MTSVNLLTRSGFTQKLVKVRTEEETVKLYYHLMGKDTVPLIGIAGIMDNPKTGMEQYRVAVQLDLVKWMLGLQDAIAGEIFPTVEAQLLDAK